MLCVGDEVTNNKGMGKAGQGSLHEARCIIMATIADCVLNAINKVGGIRLHEAEIRATGHSTTSSQFFRNDPQQVSRLQDNCLKIIESRVNNPVESKMIV